MNTPYFVIHEEKLQSNIDNFKSALLKNWSNSRLCYSVKTNSLPWVLKYMDKQEIYLEVVSDEEYALAIALGIKDSHIVFNGPIKGEETFKRAAQLGAIINLDSKSDVEYLKRYREYICPELIGVRINVPTQLFDVNDIGYADDGFRFGFSDKTGELQSVFEVISKFFPTSRIGLHLHINSVTRGIAVYRSVAKYASEIIRKYELSVSFIDIGGGFFGGVEGKPSGDDYIVTIKNELADTIDVKNVELLIEPGTAIIGSAADLVTSVLDVKKTDRATIVTTDGSRIHIDPLWKKNSYSYSIQCRANFTTRHKEEKQIICGYTCMDHDRMMTLSNVIALNVGDNIVYKRVGAYTMTFGGAFIRYFPDVYVGKNNEYMCVRDAITTDEYIHINTEKQEGGHNA